MYNTFTLETGKDSDMRTYKEKVITVKEKDKAFCNCCGREIKGEDFLEVEKQWGYFSSKDGVTECFDLCEECYDKLVSGFKISPERKEII